MRLVVWNCCNGLGAIEQIDQFRSFNADLAILPELKEKNVAALSPSGSIWVTNNTHSNSPKGLGVLVFNGGSIEVLESDEEMEIYIPLEIKLGGFEFGMLAVWNFYHACKQGRFKGLKGEACLEWEAVRHYTPLMQDRRFLMAGDFNFGPTFSQAAFEKLCGMLKMRGVTSLYHSHYKLPNARSNHPTFRTPTGKLHHLDHVFGSLEMAKRLRGYEVLPLNSAVRSDHAPIICDFELEETVC